MKTLTLPLVMVSLMTWGNVHWFVFLYIMLSLLILGFLFGLYEKTIDKVSWHW